MATEKTFTISGTPTVVSGVTVPFVDSSDLEIYVGKGKIESIEVTNAGAGYTNRARGAAEKLIFSGGDGTAPDLWITVGQDTDNSGRIDGSIYGHATSGAALDNTNLNVGSGYTKSPNISLTNLDGGEGGQLTAKIFAKKTPVSDYTISGTSGAATITFTSALADGDKVLVKRVTDVTTAPNEFNAGSTITAKELNDSFNQLRYRVQELPEVTSTAVTNGDKGDITVSGSNWTIDSDAITTNKIINNAITSDKIVDGAVTPAKLGIDTWELKSVKAFGAKGDGIANDTAAIKDAIAAGAGVNIVYFPAGTYIVKEPIVIPSNSYIKGAGGVSTSIKMHDSIGRKTGLGVIGNWDTTVENVLVEDITFDFNTARWHGYTADQHSKKQELDSLTQIYSSETSESYTASISSNTATVDFGSNPHGYEIGEPLFINYTGDPIDEEVEVLSTDFTTTSFKYTSTSVTDGNKSIKIKAIVNCANRNALTIFNSKNVTLNRVRCLDGQRHCLDITSSFRRSSTGNTSNTNYYATATTYMHKGAQYITVNDCYFKGAGDDNLTTHFSSDILITNCLSELTRGGFGTQTNTNCFEIDDGSRNIQMYNCRAYKGNQGLEIKAHGYAPAPYNILVDGLEVINCVGGVEAHHSGWKTQIADSGNAWSAHGGQVGKTGTYARVTGGTVTVTSTSHGYVAGDKITVTYDDYTSGTNTLIKDEKKIIASADTNTFTYASSESGSDKVAEGNCTIYEIAPKDLVAGYTNDQLTSLSDDGHSATANNLTFNNIQIIAPCNRTFKKKGSSGEDTDASESKPQRCFELGMYNGVQIDNLLISDGTKDRQLTADGYVKTDNLSNHKVVVIQNSARNVQINNLTINGFRDTGKIGIKIEELVNEGITINNFNVIDGPLRALYAEAPPAANTGPVFIGTLDNYNIYQTKSVGTNIGTGTEDSITWGNLTADLQYAINFEPSQFHVGQGNIKGYGADQGVRPLTYTPLIYGSDHTTKAAIRTFEGIDDPEYSLNGNVCTVFVRQFNLKKAVSAATGDLRIMLPFRPLKDGYVAPVFTNRIDYAAAYHTVVAYVKKVDIYSNSVSKLGYVELRGIKDDTSSDDNGQVSDVINCDTIANNNVLSNTERSEIMFTLSYVIDPYADPNF